MKTSKIGDLTQLARDIEEVFKTHFGERPAFGIVFTLPPSYDMAHWVTNVAREEGIDMFKKTAQKMAAQSN